MHLYMSFHLKILLVQWRWYRIFLLSSDREMKTKHGSQLNPIESGVAILGIISIGINDIVITLNYIIISLFPYTLDYRGQRQHHTELS